MGVLLVHGAGYQANDELRFLQRQRMSAGLLSGFIAAGRLRLKTGLEEGMAATPFSIQFVEYSDALNAAGSSRTQPVATEQQSKPDFVEQRVLRCLCCPRTSRTRTNVRTWAGQAGQALPSVTESVVRRRLPDVHRYLARESGRAETIHRVSSAFDGKIDVVVGHSLGSVVTLDALARTPLNLAPRLLVTLGSPLRFDAIWNRLDAATADWISARQIAWVNVFDRGDVVTAGGSLPRERFPGVLNIRVNNNDHQHASDYYLRHPIVGNLLWEVLSGDLNTNGPNIDLPARLRSYVKYHQ